MKKIKLEKVHGSHANSKPINLRCPECYHLATLDEIKKIGDNHIYTDEGRLVIGFRVCPNSLCKLLFFVAYQHEVIEGKWNTNLILAMPRERLDFNAADIPSPIVNSLE